MSKKKCPFWQVSPHIVILGAGASRAAFPKGDKYGRLLPLMSDFCDILNLNQFFYECGIDTENCNIEDIYSDLYLKDPDSALLKELNRRVHTYFTILRIPDYVTLYDQLILSLQKKDVIFSFNWDPLIMQAYSRNISVGNLPQIHFLHGNVAIGFCVEHKRCGYLGNKCSICEKYFKPSKLLYPIKEKDYSNDPFIKSEWQALKYYLNDAFIMIIFGFGAPQTDIEAKKIMRDAWEKNRRHDLNEIEIIDILSRKNVEKNGMNSFLKVTTQFFQP